MGSDALLILADLEREGPAVKDGDGVYRLTREAMRLLSHLDARCSQCGRHLMGHEPDALGWGPVTPGRHVEGGVAGPERNGSGDAE